MSAAIIKGRIRNIFKRRFLINTVFLNNNLYLQDLGINAMEKMEMFLYLEDEFRINVSDQEIASIRTVGDTIRCIEKNLGVRYASVA